MHSVKQLCFGGTLSNAQLYFIFMLSHSSSVAENKSKEEFEGQDNERNTGCLRRVEQCCGCDLEMLYHESNSEKKRRSITKAKQNQRGT